MSIKKYGVFFGIISLIFMSFSFLYSQSEEASSIFEQNKQSVVSFVVMGEDKEEIARGTGFIIGKDLMLTNYHLVSQAKDAEGRDYRGKKVKIMGIISYNKEYNLAVLQVKSKAPALTPGNFTGVKFSDELAVIGGNEAGEIQVYEGKVINLVEFETGHKEADLNISSTKSLSGAPVFDKNGQLVGIMMYPETSSKVVIPAELINKVEKSGAVTKFKKWENEEYFETYEGSYFAAKLYAALGSSRKAANYLKKVLKIKPEELDVLVMLAETYSKQRNYSSAESIYKKIVNLKPSLDKAYMGLGIVYIKMRKWSDAVTALEKAVQLSLDHKSAYFLIGRAYMEQKSYAKAADNFIKYLELNSNNPQDAHLQLGQCYLELEQYDKAIPALEEALKLDPQSNNINYRLAQCYHKVGQYEKAEGIYSNLAQMFPDDAKVYFNNIIRMYDEAKMPDKAVNAAIKLIDLDASNHESHYNLGAMLVKQNKYIEAIESFKKAIELKPDFVYAYANMGYSYSQMKKYSNAVDAFKKLVEFSPDDSNGWFNLGINYMQQKKWSSAVEPLRKTIELRPDYGLPYYNLGIVYLNLKDDYSARELYKKLKTFDPDTASKLLKYLR